jgi:signal transduction histidine kinase
MGTTSARGPAAPDIAIAVVFAVAAEVELRTYSQSVLAGDVPLGVDTWLVLLPLVPLAWRRAAPFAACVAMATVLTVVGAGLGGTICFFGGFFPFVASVYSASAWARSPWNRVTLAVPVALMVPMHWYVPDFRIPSDLFFGVGLSAMAWAAGQGARRWRHQSHQLAAALEAAEAGRDAQAALAVADERARIARELHDVVAHGMSVMVMQAGAARPAARDDPEQVATALEHIEDVGRAAMLEMRRLLGILREDESGTRHPQPRLHALPELVEVLGRAGLRVEQRVDGEPRPLPAAQDVSAYRIVQEALTNALRHGDGSCAEVALRWQDDRLRIEVSNPVDARQRNGVGGGHGLVGIRERVALFDGRFSAGAVDGRFLTVAELPYDEVPA